MTKETTNNELARMVAEGFKETNRRIDDKTESIKTEMNKRFKQVDDRFKQVDERFTQIGGRLEHIDARLDTMSKDIATIKEHFVYRHEFNDLMDRVKYLEEKMGIDSGK